jgi:hypothetical protein
VVGHTDIEAVVGHTVAGLAVVARKAVAAGAHREKVGAVDHRAAVFLPLAHTAAGLAAVGHRVMEVEGVVDHKKVVVAWMIFSPVNVLVISQSKILPTY